MIVIVSRLGESQQINIQDQNDFNYWNSRIHRFSFNKAFIRKNKKVIGIDSINNYYDVSLKKTTSTFKKIGKKILFLLKLIYLIKFI